MARAIGISDDSLTGLIAGRLPTAATYTKLKAAFGQELPDSPTETERRRNTGRETIATARGHITEAGWKRGAAARAALEDEEKRARRIARSLATRKRTGQFEHWKARGAETNRLPGNRVMHSLFGHLRTHYRDFHEAPNVQIIHGWAEAASARFHLPSSAVLDVWTPYLRERGLWQSNAAAPRRAGGRPHSAPWCPPLVAFLSRPGGGTSRKRVRWDEAAAFVNQWLTARQQAGEARYVDGPSLRFQAYKHRPGCAALSAALPSGRRRN